MPFPLAHSAAAIAAIMTLPRMAVDALPRGQMWRLLLLLVALGNLPDLDFLPGLLLGDPSRFHHGISHSLFAAFVMATVVFWGARSYFLSIPSKRLFICLVIAGCSHTLLDYFSIDTSKPYGVPLFWPILKTYEISPVPLFLDVTRSDDSNVAFVTSLFNLHNLRGLGVEILFTVMIAGMLVATSYIPRLVCWWAGALVSIIGGAAFLLVVAL